MFVQSVSMVHFRITTTDTKKGIIKNLSIRPKWICIGGNTKGVSMVKAEKGSRETASGANGRTDNDNKRRTKMAPYSLYRMFHGYVICNIRPCYDIDYMLTNRIVVHL
jgi:hypothetical protein